MRTRVHEAVVGRQLAIIVLVAAVLAGCGSRNQPPQPLPSPSAGTVAASPAAVVPSATGARAPTSTPGAGTGTVLIAAGDIGRCDSTNDDATGALAASLPGAVATLGDMAYEDGTAKELNDCFGGAWGAVKDRIRFAVTGNHDTHTDGGAPLQAYMGSAASRDGRTWFSDMLGDWHVIVLDGNCGLAGRKCDSGSEQAQWLREDLAASHARCTVALMHQPRFSSGQHGNDPAVGPLWDALYAAGADLVLDGHDHDYERFAPQDPAGNADAARGITEVVAGMGGTWLETFKDEKANSLVRISDAYGVLEVTLQADSWSSRFVAVDGTVRDRGAGSCH
jgi:hypothetical protein